MSAYTDIERVSNGLTQEHWALEQCYAELFTLRGYVKAHGTQSKLGDVDALIQETGTVLRSLRESQAEHEAAGSQERANG